MTKQEFGKAIEWLRKAAPKVAEKFAPIYLAARHMWYSYEEGRYIPDREKIEKVLLECIDDLEKGRQDSPGKAKKYYNIRTGGLIVWIEQEKGQFIPEAISAGIEYFTAAECLDVEDGGEFKGALTEI